MSAKSARVKKLALLAMFTAIGAVLITLVHFPFSLPLPFPKKAAGEIWSRYQTPRASQRGAGRSAIPRYEPGRH